MTATPDLVPDGRAGFPFLRWSCLALLLIGEITTFGPALHLRVLQGDARVWMPRALRHDEIIDLLVAVMAATALFAWHAFRLEIVSGGAGSIGRAGAWKRWLGFHFLTVVAIAIWMEAGLPAALDESAEASAWAGTWFLGWAVLSSAMIWTWAGAVMPIDLRSRWMGHVPAAFVGGGIVAVLALRAGMRARSLWQPLQQPTLWAVFMMLGFTGSDPVVDPTAAVVGTRQFAVTIGAPCAGLEGIGLVSVLVAALLWLNRDEYRFPQAFLLWPLGIAAVWLLDAYGSRPGSPARGVGRVLVGASCPRLGLHGAARRGARISRIPSAQARFRRFRERSAAPCLRSSPSENRWTPC